MRMKQFLCTLLVCAVMVGFLSTPAKASEAAGAETIRLEDLEWEWIDLATVECLECGVMPRTSVSANGTYAAHSITAITGFSAFQANSTVTFNCSYSPSSASLDIGVLTPEGKFYSINVRGGSINQTIGINQSGSYSVAIRNNSSQTVSVVGFVEY